MLLETRVIDLHYAADSLCLSSFKFFWWVPQHFSISIYFYKRGHFGRSRSSKVDKFAANRKRIFDFLLVSNSNLGPILHRFGVMTAFMCSWPQAYSTLILGVFPLHQIAHVGRQWAHGPSAIRPWNYFRRIPTHSITVPDRHRQTDRQTDDMQSQNCAMR